MRPSSEGLHTVRGELKASNCQCSGRRRHHLRSCKTLTLLLALDHGSRPLANSGTPDAPVFQTMPRRSASSDGQLHCITSRISCFGLEFPWDGALIRPGSTAVTVTGATPLVVNRGLVRGEARPAQRQLLFRRPRKWL
jgi:hypothetical protein